MGGGDQNKTATTNTDPGSQKNVTIKKQYICQLKIRKNFMDDELPIIKTSSRVKNVATGTNKKGKTTYRKEVVYDLTLEATVTKSGQPATGLLLNFKSNRNEEGKDNQQVDVLEALELTNAQGKTKVCLTTSTPGTVKLSITNPEIEMKEFFVTIKEAWYESKFKLTYYAMYSETDSRFAKDTTEVNEYAGVTVEKDGKHKKTFLAQVMLQGSGYPSSGGTVIAYDVPNKKFVYRTQVIGSQGPLTANHSIAVDPKVIPYKRKVEIYFPLSVKSTMTLLGVRWAEDTGGNVKNHHIDLYMSNTKDADDWSKQYGTMNGAAVKYLGE